MSNSYAVLGLVSALFCGCSLVVSDDPPDSELPTAGCSNSPVRRIDLDRAPEGDEVTSGGLISVYEGIDFLEQWAYTANGLVENPAPGLRFAFSSSTSGSFTFPSLQCLTGLRVWV